MKPTYDQLLNVVRALVAATSDEDRRKVADAARPLLLLKTPAALATPDTLPPVAVGDIVHHLDPRFGHHCISWIREPESLRFLRDCEPEHYIAIYRTPLWQRGPRRPRPLRGRPRQDAPVTTPPRIDATMRQTVDSSTWRST